MSWNPSTGSDFPEWPSDSWTDPEHERTLLRRRLQRFRFGFSMLGLALVIASLTTIGSLILIFSGHRPQLGLLLGIQHWDLIEESVIVWGSLLGVVLLCGRWPSNPGWQGRSGLLLLMCLTDAVLWGLDHSTDLGLSDVTIGHDWFRHCLGRALGWSQFALIAGLAGDVAGRLGDPQAIDFAKAVRSLSTTGAMVWFMYFFFVTNWVAPIWPLKERPLNPGSYMLLLGWLVLGAILLVQVTGLTLVAGRCCGRSLREMAIEDRANDLPASRSEAGWEELNGPGGSGPNRRA